MQLRQILGADTIRRRHIIHIAGHNDHREIGSQRKEHHIHGIANGIQPEALVVADTGQKLRNYGTGNKTDGNRPSCANQELNQADHHTAQETPVTLAGEFVKVGTPAPEFTLVKGDLSNYTLKDGKGKYLVLNIFTSMDTGVCATSVRKFNQLAANRPNVTVLAISKDLPFAQGRFCTTEGIANVVPLSDYRYTSDFAQKYGVDRKSVV